MLLGPSHRPEFWPEWIVAAGLALEALPPVRQLDGFLLYEAAANAMGVAIGLNPLVGPFLDNGRLARPLGQEARSSRSFYLVRAPGNSDHSVRSFQRWLSSQARTDVTSRPAAPAGVNAEG